MTGRSGHRIVPTTTRRRRRVQDAVHGTMEFLGSQTVILEFLRTREISRLRDIKQLGLAHLVYPSAEHSRFAHALGAAHVAIRFGEHLREVGRAYLPPALLPTDETIRDLALTALCHDIGHGPFSHAWERDVLTKHFDRAPWCEALGLDPAMAREREYAWHELVTLGLLLADGSEIRARFESMEPGMSRRVAAALSGEHWPSYMKQLVASDVDADRGDYLVRDSLMTGLVYGNIDVSRLIDCSCIAEGPDAQLVVAFEERRARSAVADFLQGRAAMYESVYFHKTIRGAEALMGLLMRRLAEDDINQVYRRRVGPLSRTVLDILAFNGISADKLMHLHDRSVWTLVEEVALLRPYDMTAQLLAQRLLKRQLLHVVDVDPDRLKAALRSGSLHERVSEAVAPFFKGCAPSSFFVLDEARTVSIGARQFGGYFLLPDGSLRSFADDERLRVSVPPSVSVEDRLFVPREAVQATEEALRSIS